jgi:hypothetical protein
VQPDLAVSVASSRILFIRRFAAGSGISEEVLERRWSDIKNGYNKAYEKPFEDIRVWFESKHPDTELSPTTISSGLLCDYLLHLKERVYIMMSFVTPVRLLRWRALWRRMARFSSAEGNKK